MQGLVSSHTEGFADPSGLDGEIVERSYGYQYENGRMNVTGHGWLGFDKRTVTEHVLDQVRTVTTTYQPVARYTSAGVVTTSTTPPYLYPLAGLPQTVVVDQGLVDPAAGKSPIEDAVRTRRTIISQTWGVQLSADARPFPILNETRTQTFSRPVGADGDGDRRTDCFDINENIDGYGNVTHNLKTCGDNDLADPISFERLDTQTRYLPESFPDDPLRWVVGNPEAHYDSGDARRPLQTPNH